MPMLSPVRTITETATDRSNLSSALGSLQNAVTTQESLFTGATPALPVPSELSDITAAITNVSTELTTLSGAGYTPDGIRECRDNIRDLCKMVKKAESSMDPYRVEYRTDVVSLIDAVEENNKNLMSRALGGKIRRNTARIVNTAPVQAIAEHKGKIAGVVGAGAVLWGVLQMDGCAPSNQMPPTQSKKPTSEEYHPVNKRDVDGGKEYDGNGTNFSVGGFLNASKTTFANGASPESQAFQGVWNYIDEHCDDQKKWLPGERFHFHTTPNKNLVDATHYDVNAYTGDHDTKVIEITWQKDHGQEKKGKEVEVEQLNHHTWRFVLHSNGTIERINIYHDGRGEKSVGFISKAAFQSDLKKIQGF